MRSALDRVYLRRHTPGPTDRMVSAATSVLSAKCWLVLLLAATVGVPAGGQQTEQRTGPNVTRLLRTLQDTPWKPVWTMEYNGQGWVSSYGTHAVRRTSSGRLEVSIRVDSTEVADDINADYNRSVYRFQVDCRTKHFAFLTAAKYYNGELVRWHQWDKPEPWESIPKPYEWAEGLRGFCREQDGAR